MWLIAGLGNPGQEHQGTRHNVGFDVLDRLAERAGARLSDKKFKARSGRGRLVGRDVLLMKPQTFMNLSGEAVGPALGFFKIGTDRLIVVHDELDLAFGEVQTKEGGGHRGHNGLRSLHKHLPNDRYLRVRLGIGRPPPAWDPADYVLGRFSAEHRRALDTVIDRAVDQIESILNNEGVRADDGGVRGSRRERTKIGAGGRSSSAGR